MNAAESKFDELKADRDAGKASAIAYLDNEASDLEKIRAAVKSLSPAGVFLQLQQMAQRLQRHRLQQMRAKYDYVAGKMTSKAGIKAQLVDFITQVEESLQRERGESQANLAAAEAHAAATFKTMTDAAKAVQDGSMHAVGGLCKSNPLDPQLASARFQPLSL